MAPRPRRSLLHPAGSVLAGVALVLAVACAAGLVAAVLGNRSGWWSFQQSFAILKWTVYADFIALLVSAAGLVLALVSRSWGSAMSTVAALVISAGVLWVPASMREAARRVPPIHDITTDMEQPPRFVAVLERRRDAPNSTEYEGPALAALQKAAYPDLAPAELGVAPARAFDAAGRAARALGWEIVASVPGEGRLEATDTTPWWGFKDDVVVRVTPSARGSRVDVRSVSRVGQSDLGVNARRIRAFLRELRAAAAGG